jgi:hypothetical protein
MEKTIQVLPLTYKDKSDTLYWLQKTPAERFEALEMLRQRFYGYDETTQRFQRVIECINLKDLKE